MKSKSYDDGTPRACFYYDETSVTVGNWTSPTLGNPTGRLTHTITTAATTCLSNPTASSATVSSYDPMGRPKGYWQCSPFNCGSASIWNMQYTYDLAGDVTSWGHPASFTITHAINAAQRVTQITSSLSDGTRPATLLADIAYWPFGAVQFMVDGAVTGGTHRQETYEYNKRLQVDMQRLGTSADFGANYCFMHNYYPGNSLPANCGTYPSRTGSNNNGNVISYYFSDHAASPTPNMDHNASFSSDALNRLNAASATGSQSYNLGFESDRWGNTDCPGGGSGYCANWSFDTTTNRISTSGFSYDAAGNMIASDSGNTYQWDAEGRLKSINNGALASEIYNALGQRVDHTWPGNRIHWLFHPDGTEMADFWAVPWNDWGNVYFNLNGRPIAKYIGGVADGEAFFFHANHLGSTSMITHFDGNVVQKELFYPYGQLWATGGNIGSYRFASLREYFPVSDSAEIFMSQTRDYPSRFYRWLAPDPLAGDISNPQSLNRYAYVVNNPTNLIDPQGLDGCLTGPNGAIESCTFSTTVWAPMPTSQTPSGPGGLDIEFWMTASGLYGPPGQPLLYRPGATRSGGGKSSGNKPCGKKGIGGGLGLSWSWSLDIGIGESAGMTIGGTWGVGLFYDSDTGLSWGASETIASARWWNNEVTSATPSQDVTNPSAWGAFWGAGANGWITNARSVNQLAGHSEQRTLNVGKGLVPITIQTNEAGGIRQAQVGRGGYGAGGSLTRVTANTSTVGNGCD